MERTLGLGVVQAAAAAAVQQQFSLVVSEL
jgi:hypothetical protein